MGSYAKIELLHAEYTEEVTGKDLYDLLGKSTIDSIAKDGKDGKDEYSLTVTVDGEDRYSKDEGVKGVKTVFNETNMNRNNKSGVGGTGNGVLTQVFVDTGKKDVQIAVINTYLARAAGDYNEKRDDVSLDVYAISKATDSTNTYFWKNTANETGVFVDDNVKVVLIQTNDLKETVTFESGVNQLKQNLDRLNRAEDGKFDYTISMIIEDGMAKIVILKDANDETSNKGDEEKEPPEGRGRRRLC